MNTFSNRSLCAAVAISATLTLGSTPAFAQEVAPATPPTVQLPPAAAAPRIVLPPTVTAPAPAAPQADAVSERAVRSDRAAQPARSAERAPTPAVGREAPAPSTPVSAPAVPVAAPVATPPVAAAAVPIAPQVQPVPDDQPDSVRREIDVPDEIIAASILGVLGLGLAGFVATRRRRRRDEMVEEKYETVYVEEPVTSIPEALSVRSAPRAEPQPEVDIAQAQPPIAAASLASGPVPSGEARQQLIDRMVAAEPDAENPFTSRAARRKRARIILQAREHSQRLGAEQGAAAFDWRSYKAPTTPDPATPPLVDA